MQMMQILRRLTSSPIDTSTLGFDNDIVIGILEKGLVGWDASVPNASARPENSWADEGISSQDVMCKWALI